MTASPPAGCSALASARSILSAGRHKLSGSRAVEAAQRQELIARLRGQHPDWSQEQILFAALAELHREMDAEFARGAAAHIAEWSAAQGVNVGN